MSRNKTNKLKKHEAHQISQVQENNSIFDVIGLLRTENTDTKPNMGKFLKQYVKDIKAVMSGNVYFYPKFGYRISRVFVEFFDRHELIFYPDRSTEHGRFIYTYEYDDIEFNKDAAELFETFFKRLFEFKFVVNTQSD